MNFNSKALSFIISLMLIIEGTFICFTKKLPIGSHNGYIEIGNYAYIVTITLVGYGLRILYYLIYQQKEKEG